MSLLDRLRKKYVGKEFAIVVKDGKIALAVNVLDVRTAYGRQEVLVEPVGAIDGNAMGRVWVTVQSLYTE